MATTLTGGGVGVKYRYGPYGTETYKQILNASGESELGFTGGLKLATNSSDTVAYAKLILLGARVYHVDLRRWLQPDAVNLKRYTYANGDPVNLTDPSGQMPISDLFADCPLRLRRELCRSRIAHTVNRQQWRSNAAGSRG